MEKSPLRLTIITPKGLFLEESVIEVYAPGSIGITGILKDHLPLVAKLDFGELRYKPLKDPQKYLFIGRGYLEVEKNKITILSEKVEKVEDLDLSALQEGVTQLTKTIKDASQGKTKREELEEALKKRKIFKAKLDIIKKSKKK